MPKLTKTAIQTRRRLRTMVSNVGWAATAGTLLERLPSGEYTGEDVRLALTKKGLPDPTHPNAWGGVIRGGQTRGVLVPTGKYRPVISERSHGRKIAVYVKN